MIKTVIIYILIIQFILYGGDNMDNSKGKYAWTVKVGEKGQLVIPKEARDVFNINPGDTLIILGDLEQGLAIPPKTAFEGIINQIFAGKMPKGDD